MPPVLVHNLMLLGGIVLSAAGIFMLALHLTGSRGAGVTAGHRVRVRALPLRALHAHGAAVDRVDPVGVLGAASHVRDQARGDTQGMLGAFVALQFLSSIYYGIFLATLLALCAVASACARCARPAEERSLGTGDRRGRRRDPVAPYAIPYAATKQQRRAPAPKRTGADAQRPAVELPVATRFELPVRRTLRAARARPERRLFPGILTAAARDRRAAAASSVERGHRLSRSALVAAFEMSLGFYGYTFSFLYHHVPVFDGLRAPARLGIFVVFFLAILAAYGHAALEAAGSRRAPVAPPRRDFSRSAARVLGGAASPRALPERAPPLYAWLAKQPRGVVAEFPMPAPDTLPGIEPRYAYMSTFHWMPIVNGYSGYYPPSYSRGSPR